MLTPWKDVWKRVGASVPAKGVFLALFMAGLFALPALERFFWFLDGANLMIHEGGHSFFGIVGSHFLMVLGGTLAQLLAPLGFALAFLSRGQALYADGALFWFGQNFLGVGTYMSDARAQKLDLFSPTTLVGGKDSHDWTYLLKTTGLLRFDEPLGTLTKAAGVAVMVFALFCLAQHGREKLAGIGKK
ncbi:MAG: hypothetical protein A2X36_09325 [Elusimicrobia bacterium GWA2_69_24]|nr:MAG: hypothetical protein A2X36_09325 [Elusimicrobia bacterium GWA2_69_24]HBL15970.1 hypothetical protein [Elusimicrobiota bacterium]